ncbi:MAG: hypothetical protein GY757_52395, partial [bacterium]|nr:hypothetical protein [bacterium]
MDKRIIILIVGLLIVFGFEATGELVKAGTKGNAGQPEHSPGQHYVAGEVIIKMDPDSDEKYCWNGDLWRKTAKARRFRSTAGSLK